MITRKINKFCFSLILFWLISSSTAFASFIGDWRNIDDASLFQNYYQVIPKKPGETRLLIFGIAESYDEVSNEVISAIRNSAMTYTSNPASTGSTYEPNVRVVKTNENVQASQLSKDINSWAALHSIPPEEVERIYARNLIRLEEKVIADADFIYYDVRQFYIDRNANSRVNIAAGLNIYFHPNPQGIANFQVSLPPSAPDAIASYTFQGRYFTAKEYQIISAKPEWASKTYLTWAGIPIRADQANHIIKNAFNGINNPRFGTNSGSKNIQFLLVEKTHSSRVVKLLNNSGGSCNL